MPKDSGHHCCPAQSRHAARKEEHGEIGATPQGRKPPKWN